MQRKATKSPADILLPVAPDELGDLRAEAGVNLAVALGVVAKKIDGRELDRLEKGPSLFAGRALRARIA